MAASQIVISKLEKVLVRAQKCVLGPSFRRISLSLIIFPIQFSLSRTSDGIVTVKIPYIWRWKLI